MEKKIDITEILAACKFYKGENKCPFKYKSPHYVLWYIEKQFKEEFATEEYCNELIESAKQYRTMIQTNNKRTTLSQKFLQKNIPEQALAVHIQNCLQKWNPYECDNILKEY
jgi:hypothetical protein